MKDQDARRTRRRSLVRFGWMTEVLKRCRRVGNTRPQFT